MNRQPEPPIVPNRITDHATATPTDPPIGQSGLASSAPQQAADQRRQWRIPVRWSACCTFPDGTSEDVIIIDVTLGGFGLDRDIPAATEQSLTIALNEIGIFACRVAWKSGTRCGLELLASEPSVTGDGMRELTAVLSARS